MRGPQLFQIEKDESLIASKSTILVDGNKRLVHSNKDKFVVIGGLKDLILVNTLGALLICKKENEQQVQEYVARVKEVKVELYI